VGGGLRPFSLYLARVRVVFFVVSDGLFAADVGPLSLRLVVYWVLVWRVMVCPFPALDIWATRLLLGGFAVVCGGRVQLNFRLRTASAESVNLWARGPG